MKKNTIIALLPVILLVFCACSAQFGCSFQSQNTTSADPLEPYKRVEIAASNLYVAQWNDYQARTARPELLTEAQKSVYRQRRELLVKFEAALQAYRSFLNLGQAPPAEIANRLTDLINQVEAGIGK